MTNWMKYEKAETDDEEGGTSEKVVSGIGLFLPMVSQRSPRDSSCPGYRSHTSINSLWPH